MRQLNRNLLLASAGCALLLLSARPSAEAGPLAASASPVQAKAGQVTAAANAFLATLDSKQRAAVVYAFSDDQQRARWSNFPTGFVPRGGLSLKQMSVTQRAAALALVSTVLSPKGYEKVQEIMEADDAFKLIAKDHPPGGGARGGPGGGPPPGASPSGVGGPPPFGGPNGPGPGAAMFGSDLYYISILGTPSVKDPWMLQFGGHHLALNITVVGGQGILTPTLTGAQPATFTLKGKTLRPLGGENDKAFALLAALDDKQRQQAILKYKVGDLVLGPGHDGETIEPEGLKASAMTPAQQAMLLDLVAEWAGIVDDVFASGRMGEIKAGLDDTWFAWSGPTTVEKGKNGSSYYRIQGPKLVIEYAPQPGEDHVHTMYRDPTNDYGKAAARQ